MKKKRIFPLLPWTARSGAFAVGLCFLLVGALPASRSFPEESPPKRIENAKPGDCRACHGTRAVQPPGHVETTEMSASDCRECHKGPDKGLRTKIPLGHTHSLNGTGCRDCHASDQPFEAVMTNECLGCHGSFDEVAQNTAGMDPDPHNSPHYGKEQDCDLCHHQHMSSENFCSQCHEWKLTVP